MKDYSEYSNDNNTFIKNYEIQNDKMLVNVTKGKNWVLDYNEENENTIATAMENQAIDCNKYLIDIINDVNFSTETLCAMSALTTFSLLQLGHIKSSDPVANAVVASSSALCILIHLGKLIHLNNMKKDIDKNIEYLSCSANLKENGININDIDKMSLKELKRIKNLMNSENKETSLIKNLNTKHYK